MDKKYMSKSSGGNSNTVLVKAYGVSSVGGVCESKIFINKVKLKFGSPFGGKYVLFKCDITYNDVWSFNFYRRPCKIIQNILIYFAFM